MLANVTGLSLKNFSAGYWTFAERLFPSKIDLCRRLFGFSFLFHFRVALFEFKTDVSLAGHHENLFECSALARDETLEQIGPAAGEQFLHLIAVHRSLEDDLARSKIARLIWAD